MLFLKLNEEHLDPVSSIARHRRLSGPLVARFLGFSRVAGVGRNGFSPWNSHGSGKQKPLGLRKMLLLSGPCYPCHHVKFHDKQFFNAGPHPL